MSLWKPDALARRIQLPLLPRLRVGLPSHLHCSCQDGSGHRNFNRAMI